MQRVNTGTRSLNKPERCEDRTDEEETHPDSEPRPGIGRPGDFGSWILGRKRVSARVHGKHADKCRSVKLKPSGVATQMPHIVDRCIKLTERTGFQVGQKRMRNVECARGELEGRPTFGPTPGECPADVSIGTKWSGCAHGFE